MKKATIIKQIDYTAPPVRSVPNIIALMRSEQAYRFNKAEHALLVAYADKLAIDNENAFNALTTIREALKDSPSALATLIINTCSQVLASR